MDKNPKLGNQICYGLDLRTEKLKKQVSLQHLIDLYQAFPEKDKFFLSYFDKLAGNKILKDQIKSGMTEKQIRDTWKGGLDSFKAKRKKYLLYK